MGIEKLCKKKNKRDKFAYIVKRHTFASIMRYGICAYNTCDYTVMFRSGAVSALDGTSLPNTPVQTPTVTPESAVAQPVSMIRRGC